MTNRKRQSTRDNRIRIRGDCRSGALENGDRHEVRSECNNNIVGRGAILQGYKAKRIDNLIKVKSVLSFNLMIYIIFIFSQGKFENLRITFQL